VRITRIVVVFICLLIVNSGCNEQSTDENVQDVQVESSTQSPVLDSADTKQEAENPNVSNPSLPEARADEVIRMVHKTIGDLGVHCLLSYEGIKERDGVMYYAVKYYVPQTSNKSKEIIVCRYYINTEDMNRIYRADVYRADGKEDNFKQINSINLVLEINNSEDTYSLTRQQLDKVIDKDNVKTVWSPSNRYLLFFEESLEGNNGKCYVWDSEKSQLTIPKDLYGCGATWSPNSQYFVVDDGTTLLRSGYIYSIQNNTSLETLSYAGRVLWLDSENIVYSKENNAFLIEWSEVGSTDVIIHNIKTGENKAIFTGTSDFYYRVKEIVDESTIVCTKNYFEDDTKQELVKYKFKGVY
jgi:hypothetical protein